MDLFDELARPDERLGPGALLLRGFASGAADTILATLHCIARDAPFRCMMTPGGRAMSVAMTNCGPLGWITDSTGYRYDSIDPDSGRPWPAMPAAFGDLAIKAATAAGFPGFFPDACLINRYEPGARLSLHQDRNECDLMAPIVSISLGVPAAFLWGGMMRTARARRYRVVHGDVVVWGGPARMTFHGIEPLARADHPVTGHYRYNLTFRKAA